VIDLELTKYDWVLGALVGAAIVTFIFMIPAAVGEQTVKTVEVPIGYIAQTTAGNDYMQTMMIKPPDGVQEIISFELFVVGDFQSSTDLKARVRKTGTAPIFDCTPNTWTTPSIDTPNYEASYDCSSLADEYDFTTGKIDVGFRTSKIAQNVKGFARMTYYNNPRVGISVHGTEYVEGQQGKIHLQLLDEDSLPVNNATCFVNVYNPIGTLFLNESVMTTLGTDGLYYKDVLIPSQTGVYMISAWCYTPELISSGFINETIAWEDWESGDFSGGTGWNDGNWYRSETSNNFVLTTDPYNGTYHFDIENQYPWVDRGVNLSGKNMDNMWVSFYARCVSVEAGDEFKFYTNDEPSPATNLRYTWTDCNDADYSQYIFSLAGYDDFDDFDVAFQGAAGSDLDDLYVDDIRFFEYAEQFTIDNTTEYQIVRGSGELHVSEAVNVSGINVTVLDALASFDEAKFVGATEYETGDEGKFMVQYIRTIAGSPSPENAANCTVNVTYPNGTLYLTNYQLDYLTGSNGIYEKTFTVPSTVGVYTADYYCLKAPKSVYGSDTFHVSYPINTTAISENVWEYPTRNLTYYPPFDYPQMSEYVWNYSDRQVNLTQVLEAVDALNDSTQSYFVVIENGILGLTNVSAFEIWNFTNRSLTTDEVVLHVSGTEYATGEEGTVWNILYRITPSGTYTPINDADCEAYIRYPNATNFIVNGTMEYITGSFGFYRYNFTVPNTTGVYVGGVLCKDATREYIETGTFHVAEWANYISGLNNQTFDYAEAALYNWNLTTRTLTDYNQTGILNYLLNINTTTWDTNYWVKQNNDILINLTLGNVTVFANINWTRLRMEVWNKTTPEKLEHDILSFADDEIVLVETRDFCTDNTTLMHQLNVTRCILSTCWDDNTENPEMCDWGCFENKCRPDPMWSNLWLILIIIMIGVGMYVVNAVVK